MIVLTKNPFWEKRILPMYSLFLGNPVLNLSLADLRTLADPVMILADPMPDPAAGSLPSAPARRVMVPRGRCIFYTMLCPRNSR